MKELEPFRGHRKDVTVTKLLRLKSPTHMIIVFGFLHGILLDIFFSVVATIIRPSSGAEIGLAIQLVISSMSVTAKVMVSKILP
ncbi:uncharacterized protein LOC130782371 [Actinidia eriantha]|uniref:uncharacterized protein LOC130782371 n=1 Tax=Actinidia eriantha TaxID=165200 RepID=UPI0025869738|nr:uncharacterized protein LOC130782371 [Actinidia eriantha]